MEASLRLVRGPHRLYTGANGRHTYGVRLASVRDLSCCDPRFYPYQREWSENDCSVARWDAERVAEQLGVTADSVRKLQAEVAALCESQA